MVKSFINGQDYKDICYFIDHVADVSVRLSCLEELGYRIGTDIVKGESKVKSVKIGKQGEIRMLVTPKFKNINIARCVIIENKKKKNK